MKILVLGLGNELLTDDAIGILAVRKLWERYKGQADIVESSLSGLALMDILVGYNKSIIIDAICTGQHPPGTITQLSPSDLGSTKAPSPHYSGLKEMITLASELGLEFPQEIKIYAIEVVDPRSFGGNLTPSVKKALDRLLEKVVVQLNSWGGNNLMHEYSVVQQLIEKLLEEVKKRGGAGVKEVRLRRGSTFAEGPIQQAFEIMSENTPLQGAELIIDELK